MAYTQVTLTTLLARLAERYEGVPFWSADEARRALNEGLKIYSAATGFWRTLTTVVTVPNDPFVAVSAGSLVQGTRLSWQPYPLEPCSLADLNALYPNWRSTTTATPGAPSRPVYWARISLNLFAIYPADAYIDVNANHTITINGIRNTPLLVNGGDFIDLGQETLDVLLGYALHALTLKLGGPALVSTYPGWLALLDAAAEQSAEFAASDFYRRATGQDLQRDAKPTRKAVPSVAAAALQMGQDLETPATRIKG